LSSKLGLYCGEVVEISQPLLPMGMKTPISMVPVSSARGIADERMQKADRAECQRLRQVAQVWITTAALR
jgi:hypothetical protein